KHGGVCGSPRMLPAPRRATVKAMTSALDDFRDVILRSGGTLRLRTPLAADAGAVLSFLAGLSDRSVYLRFHGFPALRPELIASFLDPDWDERGGLIGILGGAGDER